MAVTDRLDGYTPSAGWKNPVAMATTANITLSGEQTIDGVATSSSRVLVKDNTTTTENGIYDSATGAWTRSKDFDGARDVLTGTTVNVVNGTDNGGEFWYVSTAGDPAPGSAMAFTQSPIGSGVTTGTIATQNANNVSITGGTITGITDMVVADGGTGAGTFADNKLLRGQVTAAIDATGVNVGDLDEIDGFYASMKYETGTTYAPVAADTGKTIILTNASAITVTFPNTLLAGWEVEFIQGGAGQVTFAVAGGAALDHRQSHTKIAGQHGAVRAKVRLNTGGSASQVNLAGDSST